MFARKVYNTICPMRYLRNVLLIAASIFILSLVTVVVSAQTDAETARQNVKKHSEYALPYPGLLPGNPLYEIKMFRDHVFESLIVDPLKKADFYLLQSDKRLSAGMQLFKDNKKKLGEETVSKSEKYFELSVNTALLAKSKGKDTKEFTDRLAKSWDKHNEVISELIAKNSNEIKSGLESSLNLNVSQKKLMMKNFNNPMYSLPFPAQPVIPSTPTIIETK